MLTRRCAHPLPLRARAEGLPPVFLAKPLGGLVLPAPSALGLARFLKALPRKRAALGTKDVPAARCRHAISAAACAHLAVTLACFFLCACWMSTAARNISWLKAIHAASMAIAAPTVMTGWIGYLASSPRRSASPRRSVTASAASCALTVAAAPDTSVLSVCPESARLARVVIGLLSAPILGSSSLPSSS